MRTPSSRSRRTFLKTLGAGAGVALVGGRIGAAKAGERPAGTRAAGTRANRQVRDFFGDVKPGAKIGRCTILRVHGILAGAVPVILRTETGERFQVDVI